MEVFNAAFPVLPGTSDQARAFAAAINGERRSDFEESQRRFGSRRET